MSFASLIRRRRPTPIARALSTAIAPVVLLSMATAAVAQGTDPRVGLRAGWNDAGQAAKNLELVAHVDRSAGFVNPADLGNFGLINSDLAFKGNLVFQGSFHGFQVWDVSNVSSPKLRTSFVCPGGQGDPSIYGHLLFLSV